MQGPCFILHPSLSANHMARHCKCVPGFMLLPLFRLRNYFFSFITFDAVALLLLYLISSLLISRKTRVAVLLILPTASHCT
jgi:hypothetical protein